MYNIKKILNRRISDKEKINLIKEYINKDNSLNYGFNKTVKLNKEEYNKLYSNYRREIVDDFIERLDNRLYKGGKSKSNYLTLLNWIRREGIRKISNTFICPYGIEHNENEGCNC